jgi:hypothetical protein
VKYSGKIANTQGKATRGITGVTFAIYKNQEGGAQLRVETQNTTPDANGNCTVQLGTTKSSGLPIDLFDSTESHWLGVRVSGQDEQPRVQPLSVPRAADAYFHIIVYQRK